MATKAAALLFLACFVFGTFANDLILTFKVVDCYGNGVNNVMITLRGCVDPTSDNNGMPLTASTNGTGVAVFAPSATNPKAFVRYCYGSATGFCSWTATGAAGVAYNSVIQTLQKKTANGTISVTAREASGCKCDRSDNCTQTVYYDADPTTLAIDPIVFKQQGCPNLSPPASPCPPPPEQCPQECAFDVEVTRDNSQDNKLPVNETIRGICSGNLRLNEESGEKPELVCPRGYINSRQPCKSGKDCGVCCVAQTSLCAAKQSGKCSQYGGQCMCRELQDGATCQTLPFPDIIKTWNKKNRNPKSDAFGNMADRWGKEVDWSQWKQGNWNGNRKLQSFESDWGWIGANLLNKGFIDGCQDNLCEAVAAKGRFAASCCAYYP